MSIISPEDLTIALMQKKNAKNSKVINPKTGKLSFGRIPENNMGVPVGEIYLKLGFIGYSRKRKGAFGARHIWEKHKGDLDLSSPVEVPEKLTDIMEEGVDVLVDFGAKHSPVRPVVLNTKIGRVALQQEKNNDDVCYTIVSAYGAKNAPGQVIGKLKSPND